MCSVVSTTFYAEFTYVIYFVILYAINLHFFLYDIDTYFNQYHYLP